MFNCLQTFRRVFGLVFALTILTATASAASIRGTVTDPDGAVVPNAKVELIEGKASLAAVFTNAQGVYIIQQSPAPGALLRVSAQGFRTVERALPNDRPDTSIDIQLSLPALSEQVTVTSTGAPTPEAHLGAAVTLLEQPDFDGTRDIQEGLRLVPGLQVTQTGQAGGTTSLFIRGGGSDANKVLIDGIPMNDIGGAVEFANIASAAIAQAEVLRGPDSVLYGSDALAGVVSFTTHRGDTPLPLFTYAAEGGNFGTYRQEGTLSGTWRKADYFSDYSRFDTGNSLPDNRFHNGTFTGNYGWNLSSNSSLRATVHHDQVLSGQPGALALYGVPTLAQQGNEDAYFGVTWEDTTTPKWHNLLRYGGIRLRSQYTEFAAAGTPQSGYTLGAPVTIQGANGYSVSGQALESNDGPPYPYTYPASTDKDFVYAQSDYRLNPHVLGLFAFRYEDERGYSGGAGPANSVERGNYSYTFQFQGDIRDRLFYTLGGGVVDNGLFGIAGTPRASLAWDAARGTGNILSGTKLRASFGEGIKEPALFDQLDSLYALLEGLPGGNQLITQYHVAPIGPQRSRTYDGGVDESMFRGQSRIGLTLFHNEFTDGIEYIPQQGLIDLGVPSAIANAAAFGATVNSQAYRAMGIETEIESNVRHDVFVRGGYTYVDAAIQRSFTSDAIGPSFNPNFPTIPIGIYSPLIGARPFRIAPHTGYFQADYRRSRFSANLRGTLVSRRDDSDFLENFYELSNEQTMLLPNRNLDGAYQRIDLAANYQANPHIRIETSFQNLLSEHYSEAFGYPASPFMFRSGLQLSFGGESWSLK
jgi:vitamin B12 transporter